MKRNVYEHVYFTIYARFICIRLKLNKKIKVAYS